MFFYHLHTASMNPCSMSQRAAKAAEETWLCQGCNYPKRKTGKVDVEIQQPSPQDEPLNFVYGFGIPVAKKSFLESFCLDTLKRDLHLGRISLEQGDELDDWITFRGKRSLIVRGTRNTSLRLCNECGRNVYFSMGPRYLFPAPPSDHELFESDLSGLIVSQRLFNSLALHRWPKLVFEKLPVLSAPRDPFPDLISTYTES